jgi:hypothetical protein
VLSLRSCSSVSGARGQRSSHTTGGRRCTLASTVPTSSSSCTDTRASRGKSGDRSRSVRSKAQEGVIALRSTSAPACMISEAAARSSSYRAYCHHTHMPAEVSTATTHKAMMRMVFRMGEARASARQLGGTLGTRYHSAAGTCAPVNRKGREGAKTRRVVDMECGDMSPLWLQCVSLEQPRPCELSRAKTSQRAHRHEDTEGMWRGRRDDHQFSLGASVSLRPL